MYISFLPRTYKVFALTPRTAPSPSSSWLSHFGCICSIRVARGRAGSFQLYWQKKSSFLQLPSLLLTKRGNTPIGTAIYTQLKHPTIRHSIWPSSPSALERCASIMYRACIVCSLAQRNQMDSSFSVINCFRQPPRGLWGVKRAPCPTPRHTSVLCSLPLPRRLHNQLLTPPSAPSSAAHVRRGRFSRDSYSVGGRFS